MGRNGASPQHVAREQKGGDLAWRCRCRDLQHERPGAHNIGRLMAIQREADALALARADLARMRRELGQGRVERGQGLLSCGDTANAMTGCFLDIG